MGVLGATGGGGIGVLRPTGGREHKTSLKFEKCHIDAYIKNSKNDTTGNHIPLPSDWHNFYDAYTNDTIASISITPAGRNCIGEVGADGRFPVTVHVYFDPSSPDAPQRHTQLRSCTMVRENVFCVTVFKKEAQKFVESVTIASSRSGPRFHKRNKMLWESL